MRNVLYLGIVLMLLGAPARALPNAKPALVLRTDTARIQTRYFDKAYLDECRKLPEYHYEDLKQKPSLWTRFWRWFWHLFDGFKVKNSHSFYYYLAIFLKYLFIALGLATLIFILLRLAGIKNIFRKKSAEAEVPYTESLENIHEIDFNTAIEQAINEHNYRLAVRLLYLKSLKQLSDANLINWQLDKTNSAYIDELKNMEQRDAFAVLTRQFEYVWYGEFSINSQTFQNINTLFTHFKQTLA
ncbi:hypothetical protein KHS38_16845 [Mucilaginibacter sp. Bleaf8]|uniref:DUF4129 domain-containing protein n=1 Tax=Mucilaginibacter sp. Bleaf8 TaxID=2834430 RepID=UPI001BCF5896|nr:DUF4129 domain-containing protein [Mucilaginibacter sp. Bleaf8]MBS7566078.1 hypothetical protein [Mucilaginibacter sp. Bleaf8]